MMAGDPPLIVYKLSQPVPYVLLIAILGTQLGRWREGREACFSLFSPPRGEGEVESNLANSSLGRREGEEIRKFRSEIL